MAVNTDEPLFEMNIRAQIMEFEAILLGRGHRCGNRGPILFIEIMFKAAMIIKTDPVAVMAAQALVVFWLADKGVGQRRNRKIKMTRATTGGAADSGKIVSLGVKVAPEAAAAQEIITKLHQVFRLRGDGDLGKTCQGVGGPQGLADQIDTVAQGHVQGVLQVLHLFPVTFPTAVHHMIGVGGLTDEPLVRLFPCITSVVSSMAGGAVKVMFRIKHHLVALFATMNRFPCLYGGADNLFGCICFRRRARVASGDQDNEKETRK